MTTHLIEEGRGLTSCCFRNPTELPRYDRLTSDKIELSCPGLRNRHNPGEAPRTWAEHECPTAEEWARWFRHCTPQAQEGIAVRILDQCQQATRCFEQNHERLATELQHVQVYHRHRLDALLATLQELAHALQDVPPPPGSLPPSVVLGRIVDEYQGMA